MLYAIIAGTVTNDLLPDVALGLLSERLLVDLAVAQLVDVIVPLVLSELHLHTAQDFRLLVTRGITSYQ